MAWSLPGSISRQTIEVVGRAARTFASQENTGAEVVPVGENPLLEPPSWLAEFSRRNLESASLQGWIPISGERRAGRLVATFRRKFVKALKSVVYGANRVQSSGRPRSAAAKGAEGRRNAQSRGRAINGEGGQLPVRAVFL